ncbi:MAG: hypothetical protein B6U95_02975 [Thermofilum sp. ex4484_82]|nr:MAG: hypothetical protein B6U95_02975 [Thermofilum sp. ex4484_82]OYT39001.1 MAG: hypothetical protein B6U96_02970 [Archaeoglobales archaeon ex4484_92]RLE76970.1 MAG: hypothetical protein DRZ80_00055 [Thermoprotei archaeon]RLE83858.1 MAG: hypothetical protein DRJ39_04135 [Thermoprotei archaeon]
MIEKFVKSPEGLELAVLCLDYGYKLADKVCDLTRDQINFLIAAYNYRMWLMKEISETKEGWTKIIIGD